MVATTHCASVTLARRVAVFWLCSTECPVARPAVALLVVLETEVRVACAQRCARVGTRRGTHANGKAFEVSIPLVINEAANRREFLDATIEEV